MPADTLVEAAVSLRRAGDTATSVTGPVEVTNDTATIQGGPIERTVGTFEVTTGPGRMVADAAGVTTGSVGETTDTVAVTTVSIGETNGSAGEMNVSVVVSAEAIGRAGASVVVVNDTPEETIGPARAAIEPVGIVTVSAVKTTATAGETATPADPTLIALKAWLRFYIVRTRRTQAGGRYGVALHPSRWTRPGSVASQP
jgi:hypothetical protein